MIFVHLQDHLKGTVLDGSGLRGVEEEVEGGGTGAGAGAVEAEAAGASGREERGNDIVCRCEGGKHALRVIEE